MQTKTDNHPASLKAKIALRENLLGAVGADKARVLDCFCGHGAMFRAVWHQAGLYMGCDSREWEPTDPPRFIADNRRLLRCLDLQQFNVFDLDAYGSPWEQLLILAARRRWKKGEPGALAITDGSSLKLRWGQIPAAMAAMAGTGGACAPATSGGDALMRIALSGFFRRAGIKPVRIWEARGQGSAQVVYTAISFVGGA